MDLKNRVLNRLKAGALVTIVVEPDEVLAMQAIRSAAEAAAPGQVRVLRVLDGGPMLKELGDISQNGSGIYIISDLLRTLGNRPDMPRIIREVALQVRNNSARLIILETPGVDIPKHLYGDVQAIYTELPSVDELKAELEQFLSETKIPLEGNGEVRTAIANALAGLARHEASQMLSLCWVENKAKAMETLGLDPKKSKEFSKEQLGKLARLALDPTWLRNAKSKRIKENSGAALEFIDTSDAPKLGGAEVLQDWTERAKSRFASGKAKDYGLSEPKGMVIVGVPGTGKSLTPKNVSRDWGVPLIRLDIGALFGSLLGQTEQNVRNILKAVEACAPCVLWVDEIEKALGGKGGGDLDGGANTRMTGAFLTWLQDNKKPVFMIATANSVEQLRVELLRKGRVDQIYFVDLPDFEERVAIAGIHLKTKNRPGNKLGDIDAAAVAKMTDGFSGAEIEAVIVEAMGNAFYDGERATTLEDIAAVAADTTPQKVMMAQDIEKIRSWAKNNKAKYANKKAQAKAEAEKTGRRMNLGGADFGNFEPK